MKVHKEGITTMDRFTTHKEVVNSSIVKNINTVHMSKWKVTNKRHNNSMKMKWHKYIRKTLSKADVVANLQGCSPVVKGLKATVHLHIHMKKEKTTKERKREISYMLSRDIIKMMWSTCNVIKCPTKAY